LLQEETAAVLARIDGVDVTSLVQFDVEDAGSTGASIDGAMLSVTDSGSVHVGCSPGCYGTCALLWRVAGVADVIVVVLCRILVGAPRWGC
jgi:hypothetical protein